MSTSSINNNAYLASLQSASSASTSGSASSGMSAMANVNTFYNLLVTQMTHQDPMNPMSNSDLSAQLAQFSTASGVQSIQQSISALASQLSQTQGLQAAGLVGQKVIYDSNSMSLAASGTTAGGFTLTGAATNVAVDVKNASGQVVQTLSLGSLSAGVQSFSWDGNQAGNAGRAAAGNYSFDVTATDASGQPVAATPFGTGTVQSVMLGSGGAPSLQIQGQNGTVPLSGIQGVM